MSFHKNSRYFVLFYLFFVVVLMLYYFNLFLFPAGGFTFDPFKFIFVFVVSLFLSFYFTLFLLNQKKNSKLFIFLAVLLLLFYLQDYKRNLIIFNIFSENRSIYHLFEIFSSIGSLLFFSLGCFFQHRFDNSKKVSNTKRSKTNEELFV